MPTCSADGCNREATRTRKTWCEMHYYRLRRTGTTDPRPRKPKPEPRAPRPRPGTVPCGADDCDRLATRGRWCRMHAARVERHGTPDAVTHQRDRNIPRAEQSPRWTGDAATYTAVHQRLRYRRGRAAEHRCVDCGGTAAQWSYERTDGPGHRESPTGPYSVDLDDYSPRCIPCHKRFDLQHLTLTKETA